MTMMHDWSNNKQSPLCTTLNLRDVLSALVQLMGYLNLNREVFYSTCSELFSARCSAIPTNYSYPQQLAAHISELWDSVEYPGSPDVQRNSVELPYLPVIESLISTCYQASLLREEERMVTFRIILRSQSIFQANKGYLLVYIGLSLRNFVH